MASQATRSLVQTAIHHEKQEPGSMLCAQHALNNLLQGHYFDAPQLAEIATQLDELERENLEMSDADWNRREAAGRNADETGYFSVSVLETALQVWGFSLVRWASADMAPYRDAPEAQLAFILNLANHWFCIRSFGLGGEDAMWFNLNSFLPEPSWVGSGFLGALLDQSNREGYSVFVVRPTSDDMSASNPLITQFRSSAADQAASGGAVEVEDEDDELQRAIQASMAESSYASGSGPSTAGPSRQAATSSRPSMQERRRKSRRQGEEGIQEAYEAGLRRASNGGQAVASGSGSGSSSRLRAAGTRDDAITLDDDDEDDSGVLSTTRSPFLNPTVRDQLLQQIPSDEELNLAHAPGTTATSAISLPSTPTSEDYDLQDSISAYRAMSNMQSARDYDDEDAELQRALAASLASPHDDSTSLYGDAEEQARIFEQMQREREQREPTPADVGRIAKMREEARNKEREEKDRQQRHERGEMTPEPAAVVEKKDEDEEEEAEPEPVLTPEELRRRRLARFGGA